LRTSPRFISRAAISRAHFYELSYDAKGAVVAGLAFAALRDMASAVKNQQSGPITARYAYAFGPSQDGRFLRQFLYEGFNADEQDRRVFDGAPRAAAISIRALRGRMVSPFSWRRCFPISISINTIR
jgi:Alpha/beta hydrolase domain